MKIKRLRVSNFRSIKNVELEFDNTTVLVGPNNAGKTAILDAVRIALTRRWGQRGTGFTEYDIHLCDTRPDPKVGEPVIIEIETYESTPGEWSEDLQGALADIIQIDPVLGLSYIIMRVSCSWDVAEDSFVPRWEFLNSQRAPLAGRAAKAINLQEFFQFLPVFYLEALRDAGSEFSTRSQFWGKILKTVNIPENLEKKSQSIFNLLNKKLLDADPLLADLAKGLSDVGNVAATEGQAQAALRLLPLNTWDLLSQAEVIYQSEEHKPWLPLSKHGQGVQSLSVMFLFRAFVELLLSDLYNEDSEAVLALEEPETHLHPQAARSLRKHISALPGQKIVTSHSPFFLQHVPFKDIRVVRDGNKGTTVHSVPRDFRISIPKVENLEAILQKHPALLSYDSSAGKLVVKGELSEAVCRELLAAYHGLAETLEIHSKLRMLQKECLTFMPDTELTKLETFAKRIRGEIFFARKWLLVEGQSDYHLIHGIAEALDYNLDEHGISVIDFKNNGNPDCFAALARSLGFPWVALVDGDPAGLKYIEDIKSRGFDDEVITANCFSFSVGYLEQQLVADGLAVELKRILGELGFEDAEDLDENALVNKLKDGKTGYAALLARDCIADPTLTARMPKPFLDAIERVKEVT